MKTFKNFRQNLSEAKGHRFLRIDDCRKAYAEGVKDGSIGKCPKCGSPNLSGCNRCPTAPDFDQRTCDDCGTTSDKWRIKPVAESTEPAQPTDKYHDVAQQFGYKRQKTKYDHSGAWGMTSHDKWTHPDGSNIKAVTPHKMVLSQDEESHTYEPTGKPDWTVTHNGKPIGKGTGHASLKTCLGKHHSEAVKEDEGGGAPTNNAGSGNIAGIGVGPQGEPGVHPRKLKLMNGPAVDPRMFADKVFKRTPR